MIEFNSIIFRLLRRRHLSLYDRLLGWAGWWCSNILHGLLLFGLEDKDAARSRVIVPWSIPGCNYQRELLGIPDSIIGTIELLALRNLQGLLRLLLLLLWSLSFALRSIGCRRWIIVHKQVVHEFFKLCLVVIFRVFILLMLLLLLLKSI